MAIVGWLNFASSSRFTAAKAACAGQGGFPVMKRKNDARSRDAASAWSPVQFPVGLTTGFLAKSRVSPREPINF